MTRIANSALDPVISNPFSFKSNFTLDKTGLGDLTATPWLAALRALRNFSLLIVNRMRLIFLQFHSLKILTTIIRDVSCVDYVENSFPFSLLNFNTYHLRRKFIYYINNLTVSACPPSPLLPSAFRCQFSTGFPPFQRRSSPRCGPLRTVFRSRCS